MLNTNQSLSYFGGTCDQKMQIFKDLNSIKEATNSAYYALHIKS